jgi:hypothetical protein
MNGTSQNRATMKSRGCPSSSRLRGVFHARTHVVAELDVPRHADVAVVATAEDDLPRVVEFIGQNAFLAVIQPCELECLLDERAVDARRRSGVRSRRFAVNEKLVYPGGAGCSRCHLALDSHNEISSALLASMRPLSNAALGNLPALDGTRWIVRSM